MTYALPPVPPNHDTATELRRLALVVMDAADLYDEQRAADGQRLALDVAQRVTDAVQPPQPS